MTALVLRDAALEDERLDSRAASSSSFSICPTAVCSDTGCDSVAAAGVVVPDVLPLVAPDAAPDSRLASFSCWKYSSTHESASTKKKATISGTPNVVD